MRGPERSTIIACPNLRCERHEKRLVLRATLIECEEAQDVGSG